MRTCEIDQAQYWKTPFRALLGRDRLREFKIIDAEPIDIDLNDSRANLRQKFSLVKLEVARMDDFGLNDITMHINCHLGNTITFDDTVLGYDLD